MYSIKAAAIGFWWKTKFLFNVGTKPPCLFTPPGQLELGKDKYPKVSTDTVRLCNIFRMETRFWKNLLIAADQINMFYEKRLGALIEKVSKTKMALKYVLHCGNGRNKCFVLEDTTTRIAKRHLFTGNITFSKLL